MTDMTNQLISKMLAESQGKRKILVRKLSQMLDISEQSAYRRLDGSISFKLEEVEKIFNFFGWNFQQMLDSQFKDYNQAEGANQMDARAIIETLSTNWHNDIQRIAKQELPHIFMLTNILPFTTAMKYPDLVKIRMYMIAKFLWGVPAFKKRKFDLSDDAYKPIDQFTSKIDELTSTFSTTEIWGANVFKHILFDIQYLSQQSLLENHDDVTTIKEQLLLLVNLLKTYVTNNAKTASTDVKHISSAPAFHLYVNEESLVDEFTYVNWKISKRHFDQYIFTPLFGTINSTKHKGYVKNYLKNIIKRSKKIDHTNLPLVNKTFEDYTNYINQWRFNDGHDLLFLDE